MSAASRVTMAWQPCSNHAGSNYRGVQPKTVRRTKRGALGNLKDRYFLQHLKKHGVESYEASIALVRKLREQGVKTAVVSSSNNCAAVLEAAGIARLFDARVDGTDVTRLELQGKPAPDAFLEAARRVGAEPSRAVVVEDASPASRPGALADSGVSLGSIAVGTRRRCAMPALMS